MLCTPHGIKAKTMRAATFGVATLVAVFAGLQAYPLRSEVRDLIGAQQCSPSASATLSIQTGRVFSIETARSIAVKLLPAKRCLPGDKRQAPIQQAGPVARHAEWAAAYATSRAWLEKDNTSRGSEPIAATAPHFGSTFALMARKAAR